MKGLILESLFTFTTKPTNFGLLSWNQPAGSWASDVQFSVSTNSKQEITQQQLTSLSYL